jgi:hypothetical protein
MEKDYLVLKRASALRRVELRRACAGPSCRSHLQGTRGAARLALDVVVSLRTPRRSKPDAGLCRDARGRNGGIR